LSVTTLLAENKELKAKLSEANHLIQAIKDGEVDAFAMGTDSKPEVFTLQSGDYAYRILIEESGEGALNLTEDGLIVYTNKGYLDMVRLTYEKVIGTNIFDYIDDESEQHFTKLFQEALTGKSKGEINLTVGGTTVPVYMSLTSLQPHLSTIGLIISDLTDKKKSESVIVQYQNSLEEKNLALVQRNEELASFAYIASHDLQEPLRKIQLFATRIQEKGGLTDDMAKYFYRIVGGAKRMQTLIQALLGYSRLNISDVAFIPTDLNVLVKEVKNTITETMEESNATIAISALPIENVIPHQMSQLFSNLLLNSIKYKKDTIDPLITIYTRLTDAENIPVQPPHKSKRYWEIRVSDNGIGFDPAFAERIFEVFQRLHSIDAYEGTGIGLAICRKIMQTHNGYITAEGRPGEGAIFHVYLPSTNETVNKASGIG